MILERISTGTRIKIPDDLMWVDEYKWTTVASTNTYTLGGSLIIESGVRLAGRPISLEAVTDMAWVRRSTVEELQNAAQLPDERFKLIFEYPDDKREFLVVFRTEGIAVEAKPVRGFPEHNPDGWYNVSLKLLEVKNG